MSNIIKGIITTVVGGIIVFYVQGMLSRENKNVVPHSSSTENRTNPPDHPDSSLPSSVPPESTPADLETKKRPSIEEDVDDAIRKYNLGQYDVAVVKLETILRRDSGNRRATEYLRLAREQKQKAHDLFMQNIEATPSTSGSGK